MRCKICGGPMLMPEKSNVPSIPRCANCGARPESMHISPDGQASDRYMAKERPKRQDLTMGD